MCVICTLVCWSGCCGRRGGFIKSNKAKLLTRKEDDSAAGCLSAREVARLQPLICLAIMSN